MMYHTRAIILKKEEWREADWLVTALTADFGKIRLLAQGSRRHGAKLQGHIEPGSFSDISFVIGRNGYRLTTSRLCHFFSNSRNSFSKLRALAAVIKLLDDNLLEESGQTAEDIFCATSDFLSALESSATLASVRRLVVWFHVNFLRFLGLLPSPLSLEGGEIKSLLSTVGLSLARLDGVDVKEEVLEKELAGLIHALSGAVKISRLPVAFADYAVL